jgi:hypothetical protein
LIGIFKISKQAEANRTFLARQVYGFDHFDKEHQEHYYKPKYLKRVLESGKTVLAYPNGVPGGWSKTNKIHFIGHS